MPILKKDALWFRFNKLTHEERRKLSRVVEDGAKDMVKSVQNMITDVGIKTRTGNLKKAVKYQMTSMLHAKIYVDAKEAPYAEYLEEGYSPFDLKSGLFNSPKAKTSKKGNRYIRVPIGGKIVTLSESKQYTKAGKISKRFPSSWRHPGYTGKLFFKQGIEEIEPHIVSRIEDFMKEKT